MFKPGDVVRCIDNSGSANKFFNKGGIYTVHTINKNYGGYISVEEEKTKTPGWCAWRFELAYLPEIEEFL